MADTYEINEHNEVVPYTSGRRCSDTRAWRDATDLELQQREEIATQSAEIAALKANSVTTAYHDEIVAGWNKRVVALKAELEAYKGVRYVNRKLATEVERLGGTHNEIRQSYDATIRESWERECDKRCRQAKIDVLQEVKAMVDGPLGVTSEMVVDGLLEQLENGQ